MNTYELFKIGLTLENFTDSEFDDFCESLSEDDIEFCLNEGFFLKKDKGGGGFKRKNVLSKLKSFQSDGKGGIKRLGGALAHKLSKKAKQAWKGGARRTKSAIVKVFKKTKKSQRKKGGAKR